MRSDVLPFSRVSLLKVFTGIGKRRPVAGPPETGRYARLGSKTRDLREKAPRSRESYGLGFTSTLSLPEPTPPATTEKLKVAVGSGGLNPFNVVGSYLIPRM